MTMWNSRRAFLHGIVLLAVVFAFGHPLFSDPTGQPPMEDTRPFVFGVQHRPAGEVIEVLVPIFPWIRFREDAVSGVITADVTPDRLEPLQKVLELLDVPRDPVELTIHLVWGKKSSFRGTIPLAIREAEQELRDRFPFGRYEVGNSVYLPALERGKGKVEIYPDYTLEYALDRVEPASGEVDLRLAVSRLSILGDRVATVLQTNQRAHPGQPCVVGGLPVPSDRNAFEGTDQRRYDAVSDRALILVIDVSFPESTAPTREASVVDRTEG